MAEPDTSLLEPLAHAWSAGIAAAERPNPLSSRDGALLRLIPPSERLAAPALTSSLLAVLHARPHVAREAARLLRMQLVPLRPVQGGGGARITACEASAPAAAAAPARLSRQERRAALAWLRSLVYLQAGNARQALKVRNRTSRPVLTWELLLQAERLGTTLMYRTWQLPSNQAYAHMEYN